MPSIGSKVDELLGKEFGHSKVPGDTVIKSIKDRIREAAHEIDIGEDIVKHFTNMRKHGKISVMVPYKNRGEEDKVINLIKMRAKSFQVSERMGNAIFELFAMDAANESGKFNEWVFRAERMLPEAECNDVDAISRAFYSHNVFGYFTILEDPEMSDKEVALMALFFQYYIKERFNLHSWIFACDMSGVTDKMIMSPYLFRIERLEHAAE